MGFGATASTTGCGNCSGSLNTEVAMNVLLRKGESLPNTGHTEPRGLGHRLWFRSAEPQDSQESLLKLQELLLALMLFFCAVN